MGKYTFFGFVRDQLTAVPEVKKVDLEGKTVLVIGANTGLGYDAAKHFASMGPARLVLACRSPEKGKRAVFNIQDSTGYENPELWLVDLADFSSVKSFADGWAKEGGRLDILVLNAGIALPAYKPTADGWESTLQVNHLSTSLLSLLLLPYMVKTAQDFSTTSRMVVVASDLHFLAHIEKTIIEHPEKLKTYSSEKYCEPSNMATRYALSKRDALSSIVLLFHLTQLFQVLNVFFVRALADHLTPPSVIVNAVNPGFCVSGLRRSMTGTSALMAYIMEKLLARTTEQGSRFLVFGALADEHYLHGAYINRTHIEEPSDLVLSQEGQKLQEQFWVETIGILAAVDPRVQEINDKYLVKKE